MSRVCGRLLAASSLWSDGPCTLRVTRWTVIARVYRSGMGAFVRHTNSIGHRRKSYGIDCCISEGFSGPPPYAENLLTIVLFSCGHNLHKVTKLYEAPLFFPFNPRRGEDTLFTAVSIQYTTKPSTPHGHSLLALFIFSLGTPIVFTVLINATAANTGHMSQKTYVEGRGAPDIS